MTYRKTHIFLAVGLAALANVALAAEQPTPAVTDFSVVAHQHMAAHAHKHELPDAYIEQTEQMLKQAEARLSASKTLQVSTADPVTFIVPVRSVEGSRYTRRYAITNYVDHDKRYPNQTRDYMCNKRTYDTDKGYNHGGTDFASWPFQWQAMAQDAMEVVAAAGGVILARQDGYQDKNCTWDVPDTPNAVFIKHDDGTIGWYLHLKKDSVTPKKVGDRVAQGEYLGVVGSSGISSGPHLHFQVTKGTNGNIRSEVIDPYQGQCQGETSRWKDQEPYFKPELLYVVTASAVLEGPKKCGENVERPHHKKVFRPGDWFYVNLGLRDLQKDKDSEIRLTLFDSKNRIAHTKKYKLGDSMNKDHYAASWWALSAQLLPSAPLGQWRAEVAFQGNIIKESFIVGGSVHDEGTGLWFHPDFAGQGIQLQVSEVAGQEKVLASWYTYHEGKPIWLIGLGDVGVGKMTIPMTITQGKGQFPPDYRADQGKVTAWGTLEVELTAIDKATMTWQPSMDGFKAGSQEVQRLVGAASLNDDDFDSGIRACATGSWYDPNNSGHGVVVQMLEQGGKRQMAATWYAYANGEPAWLTGVGGVTGRTATLDMYQPDGGTNFPPESSGAVAQKKWGSLRFEWKNPQQAQLTWEPDADAKGKGFKSGTVTLQRLTTGFETPCY